jgi:hypothetical protein
MRVVGLLIALACAVATAHADDKPWAQGVTAESQSKALELYRKGNEAFEQARYLDALEQYQVALASWDHPSIRYNAAVCLINLGRADEAYENLMAALRFGGEPLSPDLQRQAQTYKKLLEGQLAELEVQCKEQGAKVLLDGKDLLDCPGVEARRLRPGRHQVVGEKTGYETESRAIELTAGKKTTLVLELKLLGTKGKLVPRWNKWIPWTVLGVGAAASIVAVPLYFEARSDYRAWDDQLVAFCGQGCDPATRPAEERAVLDELERERRRSALYAYSAMIVGGAALTVGVTLLVLNQPRLVGTSIKPDVGKDHAGVSLRAEW